MKPCSLISVTLLVILASIGTTTLGRAASEFSLTKTPISSELGIGQTAKLAQPIAQGVSPLQVKPNLRRCDRCDALYSIASVYIKTGAVDQALAPATGIDTKLYPFQRDSLFVDIAQAYASQKRFKEALSIVKSIESPNSQVHALAKIASEYTLAGQSDAAEATFTQALQLARRMGDLQAKSSALGIVVTQQMLVGYLASAHQIAREIPEITIQTDQLLRVAAQYQNQGQTAQAAAIFTEVKGILQAEANNSCATSPQVSEVVTYLTLARQFDQALQFAENLIPCRRIQALLALAKGYARSGQLSQANGVIEQAYMLFQSDELKSHLQAISIQSVLTQLLIDFAEAYAGVAQIETAKQMIEQAEVMARSIPEETTWLADYKSALIASIQAKAQLLVERERQEQLVKIEGMAVFDAAISEAGLYVITGRTFLARQIAQQAEVLAQNLPEETPLHTMSKQFAFAQVARVFADVGEYEQALEIAQTVEDRASCQAFGLDRIREEAQRSATSSTARRSLLLLPVVRPNTLAMKLIAAGDSAEPGQTNEMARQLEPALAIAQSTPQGTVKVRELVEIAYWYVQIGQTDKALEVLDQALEATQSIK
jgi:tetratricopeptide (TPR) repeat protein